MLWKMPSRKCVKQERDQSIMAYRKGRGGGGVGGLLAGYVGFGAAVWVCQPNV